MLARSVYEAAAKGAYPRATQNTVSPVINEALPDSTKTPYNDATNFSGSRMADYYRYGKWKEVKSKFGASAYKEIEAPGALTNQTRASRDTYSTIRVVKTEGEGKSKKEVNVIPPYTKFILESVQEARQERSQIVETFGDFYVFFFGERPMMFTYTGTLVNARNVNWVYEFSYYYETILRGTKCVEQNAKVVLQYGNTVIEGYILNSSMGITADNEGRVPFSFTCVVLKRTDINKPEDFNVYSSGAQKIQEDTIKSILDQIAGKEGKGTSEPNVSDSINSVTDALNGGKAMNYTL